MPPPIRFGLFMSQAGRSWEEILDGFLLAEELGFDHGWLVDHLVDTDLGPGVACLEAWTLLAAIAARTSRIRIGVLVTSNTFRHPALLLKEAVTVDHISHGRLILGLGSGWNVDEHRRYGIPLQPPAERVSRLEEAVELIDLLQRQERTTYAGHFYQTEDAPLDPGPIQQPGIPLLIAAHRPRMLRLAARFADQWDTFPRPSAPRPMASPCRSRSRPRPSRPPVSRPDATRPRSAARPGRKPRCSLRPRPSKPSWPSTAPSASPISRRSCPRPASATSSSMSRGRSCRGCGRTSQGPSAERQSVAPTGVADLLPAPGRGRAHARIRGLLRARGRRSRARRVTPAVVPCRTAMAHSSWAAQARGLARTTYRHGRT